MREARQFTITVTAETGDLIDEQIKSGTYASVSEVVNDGVNALTKREPALERWLRDDVMASHAEYMADPSTAVPIDDVLSRIQDARARKRA